MVIDLHRDGVNENLRLVTNVDGKPCAKIMYFNGLCMKWNNGVLSEINNLQNPYLSTNLALSFQMQLETNSLYPGLARRIYLNAYRYSLHLKDKSMLIELGAQTNTRQEIYNSIEILAKVINNTVTNE
jgi:stage II sporulation protein P